MPYGMQRTPETPAAPLPVGMATPVGNPGPLNIGGVLTIQSAQQMLDAQKKEAEAVLAAQQEQPLIQGLAGHIRRFWQQAKDAKRPIETRMFEALRAKRGEYDPAKLAQYAAQGSTIYMMLFSSKARQFGSLVRDVLLGSGSDKPWTTRPTDQPELPPEVAQEIVQQLAAEIMAAQQMGAIVTMEDARARMRDMRSQLDASLAEEARRRCELMENKMEDQMDEGGWRQALDQFIEDLTIFPAAFMQGPIIRKRKKMSWGPTGALIVEDALVVEFRRVAAWDIYPADWAEDLDSAPFVHKHRLTRRDLVAMKGVEGYSSEAIDKVLTEYGQGGLHDWTDIDDSQASAEGRQSTSYRDSDLITALQYWGSVPGKLLLEWGMGPDEVPDETMEYEVEAWLIGPYVIKAVLNQDPLGRRPYYMHSVEKVPGAFWGNSLYDLMKDLVDMCNAAARALSNNMGLSSGPQVWVNVDRMPDGEDVSAIYPWKIWQGKSDPMGNGAGKAIEFFQPNSNAAELMGIYEKFAQLADEYTGIPKYMTGTEGTPGAGRTASGLSMMIGNASKLVKQVIGGIDIDIIEPTLERLYTHNMLHSDDPDLKGDVCIQARGALSLTQKESAQMRRNEFLAATANPIDMQIIGLEGRAELLRYAAQTLDLNADKIVPPLSVIKQRAMMQQIAMAQQAQQQPQGGEESGPPQGGQNQQPKGNGQQLMNGAPVTDQFSPVKKPGGSNAAQRPRG